MYDAGRRRRLRGGRRLRHRRVQGGQGLRQAGRSASTPTSTCHAPATCRPVILTSALKRVDVAVYDFIKSFVDGAPLTGVQTFDLKNEGVGYSKSNPAVEPYEAAADAAAAEIISGEITVPDTSCRADPVPTVDPSAPARTR